MQYKLLVIIFISRDNKPVYGFADWKNPNNHRLQCNDSEFTTRSQHRKPWKQESTDTIT